MAQLDPALQQVFDAFDTPDGRQLAANVLPIIQQHVNAVNAADASEAAGQKSIANLNDTKNELLGLVKNDPTAAEMAIKIAPHLVAGIVTHSGMTSAEMEGAHKELTGHIQSEVARAAVTRMAELEAAPARQLMDNLSEHLTDQDRTSLAGYIDTMERARQYDHDASVQQGQYGAALSSGRAAFDFAQGLLDPRTDQVQIPPDFMAGLMSNAGIRPADKAPILQAYSNLRTNGDPVQSNPHLVGALLQSIADPAATVAPMDILKHSGIGLKYADAQMLHGLALGRTPEAQHMAAQLAAMVQRGATQLQPDLSAAHNAGYKRYVSWLLSAARRGGSLAPGEPNYLFKSARVMDFAPKHQDIVPPRAAPTQTLGEIFGNG